MDTLPGNWGLSVGSDVIVRVNRRSGFTTVSNAPIRDSRISYGATGLLLDLLSNSDEWKISLNNLAIRKTDGDTKIKSYTAELQKYGYLNIERSRDELGRISGTVWHIFEESQLPPKSSKSEAEVHEKPQVDFPLVANPHGDNPDVEDQPTRNNNKKNNQFEQTTTGVFALQKQHLRIGDLVKPYEREVIKAMTVNNLTCEKMQDLLDEFEKYLRQGKVSNPIGWIFAMAKGEFKKPEPIPIPRRYAEFPFSNPKNEKSEMPDATKKILQNYIRRAT